MASFTFDQDGSKWDAYMDLWIREKSSIIALRGAGSYNGISRATADRILNNDLHKWILDLPSTGFLVFLYDGDNDSPAFPDIGYIMGRLRDFWAGNVRFVAAQRNDWYSGNGKPIRNRTDYPDGIEYETFVFPQGVFPGEHNRFTQSPQLVAYPNYHQVYVGACGQISRSQLEDLNAKVTTGQKASAAIFRCKINPEVTESLVGKIYVARAEGNEEKALRLEAALEQRRQNLYGLLYTPEGERLPFWNSLKNISFSEYRIE